MSTLLNWPVILLKGLLLFPWWILEHVCFLQNSTASMLFREVFLLKRTFSCCRSLTYCCWICCSAAVLKQAEMVIDGRPCWRCGGARHEWRSACRSKVSRCTALHSFSALNANPARAWVGESTRLLRRISIALPTAPAGHRRCFQWCLQGSFLLLPPPPCAEVMARKDGVRWEAARRPKPAVPVVGSTGPPVQVVAWSPATFSRDDLMNPLLQLLIQSVQEGQHLLSCN